MGSSEVGNLRWRTRCGTGPQAHDPVRQSTPFSHCPRAFSLTSPSDQRCCRRGQHRFPAPAPFPRPPIRGPPVPRRRLIPILLIAVFLAFFLLPGFVGYLTDWWWFREIGYQVVFTRELITRLLLFLAVGGITAGVLYLNSAGRAARPGPRPDRASSSGESAPRVNITGALRRLSLPVSLVLGLLAGLRGHPGLGAWCSGRSTGRRSGSPIRSSRGTSDSTSSPCRPSRLLLGFLSTPHGFFLLSCWCHSTGCAAISSWPPAGSVVEPSAGLHLAILLAAAAAAHRAPALAGGCPQPPVFDHGPAGRRQLHRPARPAAGAPRHGGAGGARRRRRPGRRCAGAAGALRALGGRRATWLSALIGARAVPAGDAEASSWRPPN